jgi:hypothetical protein
MKSDKTPNGNSNRIKDPDNWVTGDEEMTGAQESYLQTLAEEAHEPSSRTSPKPKREACGDAEKTDRRSDHQIDPGLRGVGRLLAGTEGQEDHNPLPQSDTAPDGRSIADRQGEDAPVSKHLDARLPGSVHR